MYTIGEVSDFPDRYRKGWLAMKRSLKIVSVLDIGSNSVRMGIYQAGKTGADQLDMLEYPHRIGHEVFTTGHISPKTVRELSSLLRGYTQVMKEYGVSEYRAIATTALREAENRAYVLDQLKTQNNLVVEVLEDGEESGLIYGELLPSPYLENDAMLAYVGTGSVGVALCRRHEVVQTCNITLGFLKLSEILRSMEDRTTRFYQVIEEYVDAYFQRLSWRLAGGSARELVLTGRKLGTIASLCGAEEKDGVYRITREALDGLYAKIKNLPVKMIAEQMAVSEETADQLLPMLVIYQRMMDFALAPVILSPRLHLMDILARQMLQPSDKNRFEAQKRSGALACARELCAHRGMDLAHAERVRGYAVQLFEKLKKLHGVSGKKRILLECAALLHEAGYGVNAKNTSLATYDIIKQSYFFGLNEAETGLIAEIAQYGDLHRPGPGRAVFSDKPKLLADKFAAILNLANTLDESRKGKISEIKIRLEEERLVVTAKAREELLLEQWAFEDCASFFEDVFGIEPILIVKNGLL